MTTPVATLKKAPEGNGYATVREGDLDLPVLVYEDGSERPLNYLKLIGDVKKTADERETYRTERDKAKEAHDALLARFNNVDPDEFFETASKAIETVSALEEGDLATADKVNQMREEIRLQWEKKVEAEKTAYRDLEAKMKGEVDKRDQSIRAMRLNHAFLSSPFVRDKLSIPPDMAQIYFGKHFEDQGGRLVATDASGRTVRSRTNPSEEADFEDAIAQIVENYPDKDRILAGSGASGSGSPSASSRLQNGNTISRAEFDKLDPVKRHDYIVNKKMEVIDA